MIFFVCPPHGHKEQRKIWFMVCLNEVSTLLAEKVKSYKTVLKNSQLVFMSPVHILKIYFPNPKISARFHLRKVTPKLSGLLIS